MSVPTAPSAENEPPRRWRDRLAGPWSLRSPWAVFWVALYFATVLNLAFWRDAHAIGADLVARNGWTAMLPVVLGVPPVFALGFVIVFALPVWPYVGKPVIAALMVTSAAAMYYMVHFGVYIDLGMMRTVMETDWREGCETVTVSGMVWTAILGVLPAAAFCRTKIVYARTWRGEIGLRAGIVAGGIVLAAVMGALFLYKPVSIIARNNKEIGKRIVPFNYVFGMARYAKTRFPKAHRPLQLLDPEAQLDPIPDEHFTVFILVVGETARSMNFSLNGYPRDTNPQLAREDVISFADVAASGTYTAFSLPCMFSHLERKDFDVDASRRRENLLDLLQQAGYEVTWRENNSGDKGVADRLAPGRYAESKAYASDRFVNGDTYYDEALLEGLEEYLAGLDRDAVIVLHMLGSHGPTYHKRYPPEFKRFTPACETAEIQSAPREHIVNTYDNTILYTDHVLASAIRLLKKFPHFESGLLYVSDHGESLGENGLYLHGIPYLIAPKEQVRVPMILWMSPNMKKYDHIDYEKLRADAGRPLAHDHLFHSMLSLLEVDTERYNPELDLFAGYRTGGYVHQAAETGGRKARGFVPAYPADADARQP